jgi:hypothetical protein
VDALSTACNLSFELLNPLSLRQRKMHACFSADLTWHNAAHQFIAVFNPQRPQQHTVLVHNTQAHCLTGTTTQPRHQNNTTSSVKQNLNQERDAPL